MARPKVVQLSLLLYKCVVPGYGYRRYLSRGVSSITYDVRSGTFYFVQRPYDILVTYCILYRRSLVLLSKREKSINIYPILL